MTVQELLMEENKIHKGNCHQGDNGCYLCWNAENEGYGKVANCERCNDVDYTRITRSWNEQKHYILCEECRKIQDNNLEKEVNKAIGFDPFV